jgi:hypothetical protein
MSTSQPTRTAQAWSTAHVSEPGANAPAPPRPRPTEVLSLAPEDSAAISFARERARVLERLDHSASVRRLLRALYVGLSLWFTVILLDLYVTQVTGEGDLVVFCWSRILGSLVMEPARGMAASIQVGQNRPRIVSVREVAPTMWFALREVGL